MEIENEGHFSSLKARPKKPILASKDLNLPKSSSDFFPSSQNSSILLDIHDKAFLYQKSGDLYQLDDFYEFVRMQEGVTLCVRFLDKDRHQMEIYGPNNALLYIKLIESDTSYFIDMDEEIFKWIDLDNDVLRVLAFKLTQDKKLALSELKAVLAHDSSLEKRIRASDNLSKISPSSIHCSAIKTNLFEKYEEEFQQKIEVNDGIHIIRAFLVKC